MEMPDSVNLTRMVTVSNGSSRIKIVEKEYKGGEPYHHSRIVEALRKENESLKSAVSILEQKLRDVNKAHDRAEAKLDKAVSSISSMLDEIKSLMDKKDALQKQVQRWEDAHSEMIGEVELRDKLEKAKDCLGQISRMTTFPDHASNTMTLVAAHTLARTTLEELTKK